MMKTFGIPLFIWWPWFIIIADLVSYALTRDVISGIPWGEDGLQTGILVLWTPAATLLITVLIL
jgi:hypothetical protein